MNIFLHFSLNQLPSVRQNLMKKNHIKTHTHTQVAQNATHKTTTTCAPFKLQWFANNDQLRNNSRQSVKLHEAACESVNNQGRITV